MIEEEARQAFDAYAAGFDLYGDEWQDIGSDQYFIAGYCAAIAAQAKRIAELDAECQRLQNALRPFAEFEQVRQTMGGCTPKTGPVWAVCAKGCMVEITAEDLQAAM